MSITKVTGASFRLFAKKIMPGLIGSSWKPQPPSCLKRFNISVEVENEIYMPSLNGLHKLPITFFGIT